MKKLFFAALVATIAVGGAFAGNANTAVTLPSGTLIEAPCDSQEDVCTIDPTSQIYCTNLSSQQLFTTDPATGNCDIMLYLEIE